MPRITPSLDIRDLELVLALAEAKTTTRAASRLHLTQSAISRALLQVEDKLGVALFDRTPKGLAPTPAGTQVIEGAGAVLAQLVELEQRAKTPIETTQPVRVVCECYTAYRWLPSALAQLQKHMRVEVAFEHTHAPVAALVDAEIDIALLTTGKTRSPVREQPLFADEIVFVMAADHELADKPYITADDIAASTLIGSPNTPPDEVKYFMKAVFGSPHLPKNQARLLLPLTEAIVDASRAGLGIAALSEWIAAPYLDRTLVAKRMKKPLRRPWRIAYRPEAADRARQLASLLAGVAPRLYA
ncbi:MAG: LysR family transcriptional regulator [Kofleriaceae bacterium]